MTQRKGGGPAPDTSFERVWQVLDAQVASGRIPGYVAAVRVGGQAAVRMAPGRWGRDGGTGRPRTSTPRAAPSASC